MGCHPVAVDIMCHGLFNTEANLNFIFTPYMQFSI
jgi:hypothetical protein